MNAETKEAWDTLRSMARGHPGASSGERAAYDLVRNFADGEAVDFGDCFVRLDGTGKCAVVKLLVGLATGRTGLIELRKT